MDDVSLLLLSAEGREDIVSLWYKALAFFWPSCPIRDRRVLDGVNQYGWSRQLAQLLESVESKLLLIFVDDNCLYGKPNEAKLQVAAQHMICTDRLAIVQVQDAHHKAELDPYPALSDFGQTKRDRLHTTTVPDPAFWRRSFMLDAARMMIEHTTPEQDHGWGGFYNFELNAWRLMADRNLSALEPILGPPAPIRAIQTVKQGRWRNNAMRVCQAIGCTLDSPREFYQQGQADAAADLWRKAEHVRF